MLEGPATCTKLSSARVVIDRDKREARLDGRTLELSGLPLRILERLVIADGRLVTRAELKRQLWPYAERIDTERRLNTAVRALREALGDTAATPALIATVRGHGYRWVARERRPDRRNHFLHLAAAAIIALVAAPASLLPHQVGPSGADGLDADRRLAWTYVNRGQPAAAVPHIAELLQSTADSTDKADTGWLLLRAGMPEAALATCAGRSQLSLNLLSCRQTALARLGLVADARAVAVQIMRSAGADAATVRSVSDAPVSLGYARFLRWRVGVFVKPNRDWFRRAQLQADAGMYGEALTSLERAAATGDPLLVKIGSSAEFAPLRGTAEYRRIAVAALGKAGLS